MDLNVTVFWPKEPPLDVLGFAWRRSPTRTLPALRILGGMIVAAILIFAIGFHPREVLLGAYAIGFLLGLAWNQANEVTADKTDSHLSAVHDVLFGHMLLVILLGLHRIMTSP